MPPIKRSLDGNAGFNGTLADAIAREQAIQILVHLVLFLDVIPKLACGFTKVFIAGFAEKPLYTF